MLMMPMQEEELDLHQELLLEQQPEICRRRARRRRIWKNLLKQISSLILGMFWTQRRDPEIILEELAETSPYRIPDLISAQGAGGEDEEKEKKKKKQRKKRKKEEKKEGEAEQKKKKAQEGDEKLLLSVLGERIEGDGSDNADADADETNNAGNSRTNKKFNYSGAGELELQLLEGTRF